MFLALAHWTNKNGKVLPCTFLKENKPAKLLPWLLKWFWGRTMPDCSCVCRDRCSIADWRVCGAMPRCVKGVVTLPVCRLPAEPNKVRLGGWAWCIAWEGIEELNDIAIDWGDIPWWGVKPGSTVWQLLRSTDDLIKKTWQHRDTITHHHRHC